MADSDRKSVDDILGSRMRSGGDYPPWWPDDASELDEGESITGIVRNVREDPFWEEDDEDGRDTPAPILEVQTEDNKFSTRTHKNLVQLIEQELDIEIGDLVRFEYAGKYSAEGGTGYNYRGGAIKAEEFDEHGIDPEDFGGEATHPEPSDDDDETSSEPEAMSADDIAGDDDDEELEDFEDFDPEKDSLDDDDDEEIADEVLKFAESLMEHHGRLPLGDFDDYLNEVREFGVDPESVAKASGFEIDDGDVVYLG